jgi:vacuolar iron transporter family protein
VSQGPHSPRTRSSSRASQLFYEAERRREQEHLRKWPHLEVQELRESLAEKGLEGDVLEAAVTAISSNREKFLDYMMKEEFGVGKETERSPFKAASYVIVAFLLGSLFAFTPYYFLEAAQGVIVSTATSLGGLFLAGVIRAKASRLPAFTAGVEMMFVGVLAASITFVIGRWIGIAV